MGNARKLFQQGKKLAQVLSCTIICLGLLGTTLLSISSCKSERSKSRVPSSNNRNGDYDNGDYNGGGHNGGSELPSGGITDWSGLTNVTEISDTTARLTWPSHPAASFYVIFVKRNLEDQWLVKNHLSSDVTTIVVDQLTRDSTYYFMAKALDQYGYYDTNENYQMVHTSGAPLAPYAVTLKSPASARNFYRTPTFTVYGVKPGETVRIFKDAACTQVLASGVVANAAQEIDLTADFAAAGTYHVYANSTNIQGHSSPCSTANATYERLLCPPNYVAITGDVDLGTDPFFCVMRTEAKQGQGNVAIVQDDLMPWYQINAPNAKAACRRIDVEDFTCDLISNPQWMTIARDLERTAANWSGGVVGEGVLNRGHSDNSSAAHSIQDATNPWTQTDDDSSVWSQKRTFTLSSGETLWDFAGNVDEWVDWEFGGETITYAPYCFTTDDNNGRVSFYQVNCPNYAANDYMPANPGDIDSARYTYNNYNIGSFLGTYASMIENNDEIVALRGGGCAGSFYYAGIFQIKLNARPTYADYSVGFRCSCVPSE